MPGQLVRPDPDTLLRQIEEAEAESRRGRLKIFLGYSSGVDKSFRMLDEGRKRLERGQDVVVGALQPTTSAELMRILTKLEIIPLRTEPNGSCMGMDVIQGGSYASRASQASRPRRCLPTRKK
jgi:two-component system sensor histidine kinase KdpD